MKRYLLIPLFFLQVLSFSFLFGQDSTPENTSNPWDSPLFSDSARGQPNMDREGGESFEAKFVRMLVILGLLIGFMVLAAWALKKMMKTRVEQLNTASSIKVLETRALSPRSSLYLIEVEGKTLLIAESPTMVSHVASLDVSSQERQS